MAAENRRSTSPEREDLVRWTARLGAVTAEAGALHLGVSVASARARLHGARRAGLLAVHRPLVGQPALYTATAKGLRVCHEQGLGPCSVSPAGAHHLIVCAQVAAALARCYPEHRVLLPGATGKAPASVRSRAPSSFTHGGSKPIHKE